MDARSDISTHDALFTEVQAADALNLSIRTLQAWRSRCCGPAYIRAGRAVRYRGRDLLAWIEQNTVRPLSSFEAPEQRPS
jgi:hypothetical protein